MALVLDLLDPTVRADFAAWTARFEGRVPWMYLDVRGYVTVGLGCLVDPVERALHLPWMWRSDGCPATEAEVREDWARVKAATALAREGSGAASQVAQLELDDAAIDQLAIDRLDADVEVLARTFPEFGDYPAEVQRALCSMAWAMGAGFPSDYPKFSAAVRARDWVTAAEECWISEEGNAGVHGRNVANVALLRSAPSLG